MWKAILIGAVFFACASTAQAITLVTPQGQRVGGTLQQWANEAQVPTIRATAIFEPASICNVPGLPPTHRGCSDEGAPWELYASDRYSFYFELGHIFDAARLSNWDRMYLAKRWGVPHAPWEDSQQALASGIEDGLAVDFAAVYALCAEGQGEPQWLGSGYAPTIRTGPWACQFISSR